MIINKNIWQRLVHPIYEPQGFYQILEDESNQNQNLESRLKGMNSLCCRADNSRLVVLKQPHHDTLGCNW